MIAQGSGKTSPGPRAGAWVLSLVLPPAVAIAAFVLGLLLNDLIKDDWSSDWRFVACFGVAFLAGAAINYRLTGAITRSTGSGPLMRLSLIAYAVSVIVLSLILVGIIDDMRSGN